MENDIGFSGQTLCGQKTSSLFAQMSKYFPLSHTSISHLLAWSAYAAVCEHAREEIMCAHQIFKIAGRSRRLWRTKRRSVTKLLLNQEQARRSPEQAARRGGDVTVERWQSETPNEEMQRWEDREIKGLPDLTEDGAMRRERSTQSTQTHHTGVHSCQRGFSALRCPF